MEDYKQNQESEGSLFAAYQGLGEVPFAGASSAEDEVEVIKPAEPEEEAEQCEQSEQSEQAERAEFMEKGEFVKMVQRIIHHPAFSFEASGQEPEYTEEQLDELFKAIAELKKRVDTEFQEIEDVPRRIEAILAADIDSYPFNTDYHDITARKALGLLRGDGANCIGFSETVCIMLTTYGYEPTPVLSRLNKSGAACHYVTCYENNNGEVEIIDPERKRSCDEAEKLFSLTAYQGSLRYAVPTPEFSKVKIGGKSGIGPTFDEYFGDKQDQVIQPIREMMARLSREDDERGSVNMYEPENPEKPGVTRLELRAKSMSSRKKELLDSVINVTLRPIYEQSLALMDQPNDEEGVE